MKENPFPARIRAATAVLERAGKLDGLDESNRVAVSPENEEFVTLVEMAARGAGLALPVEADDIAHGHGQNRARITLGE